MSGKRLPWPLGTGRRRAEEEEEEASGARKGQARLPQRWEPPRLPSISSLSKMILNEMFCAFLWILTVVWRVCLAEGDTLVSLTFYESICMEDGQQDKNNAVNNYKNSERSQNPGNISCVFYYSESINYTLTCHWIPKKEKHMETTYMLTRRDSRGTNKSSCFSKNGSCSLYGVPYAASSCVELKAENEKEVKNRVLIKPEEILKPDPPQITEVKPIAGMKQMLRVSWKRPRKIPKGSYLKCQIHYTAATKNHTEDVFISDREEYNLTNLWDFTYYTVVLRCTLNESKVWSEWSIEKMGRTEEQAPLRVDLWRVIEFDQHTENRVVHLLWEECKIFPCSGLVNGYRIKYFTKSSDSLKYAKNTSDNSATLNLTKEAYIISVTAFNEAGESPEATLRIPPIHEEVMDHERIVSIKASALEEQMFLEWEPSNVEINNYIVEWYYESNSIKRSWQKINTTKWTSPKGAFIRFKYYYISVYPLYKDEIKTPCSIRTYFHQGIPAEGPTAEEVEDIDKNHATIKWKAIPEAKRNGFITNYTVFYKAEDGKEFGETVDFSVLQYRFKLLQANTKYTAHVMASTIAGGKNGTATTFITSKLSVVDIILINVVVGMFMLCLLIIGILGAVKRHIRLKDALWPKIPHPHIMATVVTMDQPVPLRKSPSADETHIIISEVQPCSKEQNEFEFTNSEDCLNETDDATEVMVGSKDTLWNEEHEAHPPTFYPEHDFRNPTLPDMKGNCYDNQEVQDQPYLKEFNPYLKNSVPTREFILSENLVQNIEGTNTQPVPMTSCLPNSTEQPYVALDTFTLLPKH
ncbi:interleukin-31 receptor subunit alpha isoform X4 [Sceloporus undulatus]|uniref:interleukin-31 receptor subunit alpha isoform X4 n=1 Tax=Sceloporus undulatus TaxID=8520 RepID=UPI001C4C136B|nr:interleukin-31 receptor subunit alpha isoform X4 [Sceloporus undulatus]